MVRLIGSDLRSRCCRCDVDGAMEKKRREDLIRQFGTAGINIYVHLNCQDAALDRIRREGKTVQPDREAYWKSGDLIGRYPDIISCDQCGTLFRDSDDGYKSFWVTTQVELSTWMRISGKKKWWQFWR